MLLCDTTVEDFPASSLDWPALHEESSQAQIQSAPLSTSEYSTNASESGRNGNLCWLVALSYAHLAFKAESEGILETDLLQHLSSHTVINEAISVSRSLEVPAEAYLDDLLKIPIFQTMFASSKTLRADINGLTHILRDWFEASCDRVKASMFTNGRKVVVCLKIITSGAPSYILFDPSPQMTKLTPPSLRKTNGIDQLAAFLQEILRTSSDLKNDVDTTFFSAYLLKQNTNAEETDIGLLGETDSTYLPGGILSPDDLVALPIIPGEPSSVLRDTTLKPIVVCLEDPDARVSILAGESNAKDTFPNSKSKSRWQEYVWPLSLQNNSLPSMDRNADDEQSSGSRGSNSRVLDLRIEITPPVAGSSRNQLTHQYQDSNQNTNGDCYAEEYASGSSKDVGRLVSSGKRASQGSQNDNWETALLQQLQDEEEIASVLPPQTSSEYTWLVALQKKLQAEEQSVSGHNPSTSILSLDFDWQLAIAVQLQQEIYQEENEANGTPRIVVESENDDRDSASRLSRPAHSSTQSGRLRVPDQIHYGDSFESLNLYTHPSSEESFPCGVCGDLHKLADTVVLEACSHRFCKECLGHFVRTKIEDRKYPIFCPECLAERARTAKTRILQDTIDQLELTSEDRRKFCEIEMISHSIVLECPRCKERMNVDRDEYSLQTILVCPLPRCAHKWCRSCLKTVASSEERHRCKNGNIDRLMKRKGWKYCPGCRTPVQKESGCNHMTCGAPGCNVHFCYRCGVLMIDTTNGGDVGTAVTDHYNDCRLFERRFKCSIQ